MAMVSAFTTVDKTAHNSRKFAFTLSPTNYGYWKTMIEPFLITNNLMGYVDGSIPYPSKTLSVTDGVTFPKENPNYPIWVSNDAYVRMLIISTISEASFRHFQEMHGDETLDAYAYLNRAQEYADALTAIGEPVKDKELVMLAVSGLREEYYGLKTAITARESPTAFSELHALLSHHDYMLGNTRAPVPSITSSFAANYAVSSPMSALGLQLSHADWAGSKGGFAIYLGSNLISWTARNQRTVLRSYTEVEYKALADTVAELTWLQALVHELGIRSSSTPILCSGKTTLLLSLAGKLAKELTISGKVTYNGHELHEFVPERTSAYISQHDVHIGQMTVRETLAFSARCQGAAATKGQEASVVTDYTLKLLGLYICADTMVGDQMKRGISGGQKKRVTTGEMIVGPYKVLLMDEISMGLDSSTTFQIVKSLKEFVHILEGTAVISLLQPAPETCDLFDDIILMTDGKIVYQGPREHVLDFFESMGFKCPERKGVADFLQEVTSKKDQQQYWMRRDDPYRFVTAEEFAKAYQSFHVGMKLENDLTTPYDKSTSHPAALATKKYGLNKIELLKACSDREILLIKRNSFVYFFKLFQLTIMSFIAMTVFLRTEMHKRDLQDGGFYTGALFFGVVTVMFNGTPEISLTIAKLPVFYKQRDFLFYPSWAYAIPSWIVKIPVSFLEAGLWTILTYYVIGFDPNVSSNGKEHDYCNTFGSFSILLVFALGGFILSRDEVKDWWLWGYWASPLMYAMNGIIVNEFLGHSWRAPLNGTTLGKQVMLARGFFADAYWYWIAVAALIGFILVFNISFGKAQADLSSLDKSDAAVELSSMDMEAEGSQNKNKGMILPFEPHSITFNDVKYSVDMPQEMKDQGVVEDRLILLKGVSGAFRPGVLTALMGVSGAGKTTLMDVLAGWKTGGYIEGDIKVSGYPKKQETFARISGYCEQNDIHSPHVTIYESLLYSAWLRLASDVDEHKRKMFVDEVMGLVELNPLKDALVGLPGVNGLSTEQRKSIDIFEAFDELLLMKRGGQELYVGPVGRNSCKLIEYFEAINGVSKIKDGYNPATWILEVSTSAQEIALGLDFTSIYRNSELHNVGHTGETPSYTAVRFMFTTFIGIIFGTMFWNLGGKRKSQQDLNNALGSMYAAVLFLGVQNAGAVQPVVGIERTVFYRERAAGMYSALPYAFAQVLVEIPYVLVQTVVYTVMVYSMIGFEWTAAKFFWYLYFQFCCFLYMTFYGMMAVAITPNASIAAIIAASFYGIFNLFSGFIIPRPSIPVWWRWYYWGNPMAWTIYGMVVSQFGDYTDELTNGETVKEYLERYYGYKDSFLGPVAAVHIGHAVIAPAFTCRNFDHAKAQRSFINVSQSILFSIKLHHGGVFTKSVNKKYNNGNTSFVDMLDIDEFFVHEIDFMLEDLGYDGRRAMFYHFLKPFCDLDNGLEPLASDKDVVLFAKYVAEGIKLVEVYVEHEKTKLDIYTPPKPKNFVIEELDDAEPRISMAEITSG
uniref:Pleiotropic drug resistance protein 1-like n=1 Tax=Tanacetum cinerariifolium TaxID=118510 RepID=A0A6L2K2V5_TANCI|nr:pleiotropic drug resistance protein 1-like [Tanacetum cinerariifolium]